MIHCKCASNFFWTSKYQTKVFNKKLGITSPHPQPWLFVFSSQNACGCGDDSLDWKPHLPQLKVYTIPPHNSSAKASTSQSFLSQSLDVFTGPFVRRSKMFFLESSSTALNLSKNVEHAVLFASIWSDGWVSSWTMRSHSSVRLKSKMAWVRAFFNGHTLILVQTTNCWLWPPDRKLKIFFTVSDNSITSELLWQIDKWKFYNS